MTISTLHATSIFKRFGAVQVLDGIDFAMTSSEAIGIVGPNGAGKSTLMAVLSGALSPTSGRVTLDGAEVTGLNATARSALGLVRTHQIPKPFAGLTVFENVLVAATHAGGARGAAAHAMTLQALDDAGMGPLANRPADSLGLLDRKRLELARALAAQPKLLLLDEIGGGLTDAEAVELVQIIRSLHGKGIGVVWIEHIVHIPLQVAERLICMDAGRIIADGDPAHRHGRPTGHARLSGGRVMAILTVENLDVRYGQFRAVRDLSLTVQQGEVVALIGANGAGKTTLLRRLAGAHRAAGGSVHFKGEDIGALPAQDQVARGLSLVPEGRHLFPDLSVTENLQLGATRGRAGDWTVDRVFEVFPNLVKRRHARASGLSGGEQQATAIGRALMSNPDLLFLDEVSLGLSPLVVDQVYASVEGVLASGTTIVIVEQDLSRAMRVASRAVCMLEGGIALDRPMDATSRDDITAAYFGLAKEVQ